VKKTSVKGWPKRDGARPFSVYNSADVVYSYDGSRLDVVAMGERVPVTVTRLERDPMDLSQKDPACPNCSCQPPPEPAWKCDGCSAVFDTFVTRAKCPSCGKTWKTTQCLFCKASSDHELWWR